MNRIDVAYIKTERSDEASLNALFDGCASYPIACNNWSGEFPYSPKVCFSIFHNGESIFLRFRVEEQDIQALVNDDMGEVWTDSCVEFFIAFDERGYYNFESSCIGRMLAAYRTSRENSQPIGDERLGNIGRIPSLGTTPFALRKGMQQWQLIEVIPAHSFSAHGITSLCGVRARANFYKCGDNLPTPHFLSWAPIDEPAPNFHIPRCFGELVFEQPKVKI